MRNCLLMINFICQRRKQRSPLSSINKMIPSITKAMIDMCLKTGLYFEKETYDSRVIIITLCIHGFNLIIIVLFVQDSRVSF